MCYILESEYVLTMENYLDKIVCPPEKSLGKSNGPPNLESPTRALSCEDGII